MSASLASNAKPLAFRLIAATLVIVVTLLICEVGFRDYTSVARIYDMEMHKYALNLKRASQLSGLSHEHVPNGKARLMGVDIATNSLGMRSRHEPAALDANTSRVLMLGNSVTFGWGVPDKGVFTDVAEETLNASANAPRTAILNAGIGNVNTRQELVLMNHLLDTVKPQIIVLHYFVDDAEVMEPGKQHWLLRKSHLAAMAYIRYRQAAFAMKPQTGSLGNYYLDLYKPDSAGWRDVQSAVEEMHKICAKKNIKFGILLQPDLHNLKSDSPQAQALKVAENLFRSQGIPCHGTSEAMAAAAGGDGNKLWVAQDDAHPNSLGHKAMGAELASFLTSLQ
jgi:lysophospholipase L1-like esterase